MNFVQNLENWVKNKDSKNGAKVAYLKVANDVEEAINAGFELKIIWQHLNEAGRFSFSYESFRQHTKKYQQANQKSG